MRYSTAVNKCHKSVKQDKKDYWKKLSGELMADFRGGRLHSAYDRLNLRMKRDGVKPIGEGSVRRPDGSTATDLGECADLRRKYFRELLNCTRSIDHKVWEQLPLLPQHGRPPVNIGPAATAVDAEPELDNTFISSSTLEEIEAAIKKLKSYKAAGVCQMIPEMFKYGGSGVLLWLHQIISNIWATGRAPGGQQIVEKH